MGKPRTHKKKTKQSNKLNNKNIIRINIGTHKKTRSTRRKKSEPKHHHHVASIPSRPAPSQVFYQYGPTPYYTPMSSTQQTQIAQTTPIVQPTAIPPAPVIPAPVIPAPTHTPSPHFSSLHLSAPSTPQSGFSSANPSVPSTPKLVPQLSFPGFKKSESFQLHPTFIIKKEPSELKVHSETHVPPKEPESFKLGLPTGGSIELLKTESLPAEPKTSKIIKKPILKPSEPSEEKQEEEILVPLKPVGKKNRRTKKRK